MSDAYHLLIELPGLPRLNTSDHVHWRTQQREAKRWSGDVIVAVRRAWRCDLPSEVLRPNLTRARLRFVRHSSVEPDRGDNLEHSFKSCRDGLVRAGVIVDDNPDTVGAPLYDWEKAPSKKGFVTIEVWAGRGDPCPTCGRTGYP